MTIDRDDQGIRTAETIFERFAQTVIDNSVRGQGTDSTVSDDTVGMPAENDQDNTSAPSAADGQHHFAGETEGEPDSHAAESVIDDNGSGEVQRPSSTSAEQEEVAPDINEHEPEITDQQRKEFLLELRRNSLKLAREADKREKKEQQRTWYLNNLKANSNRLNRATEIISVIDEIVGALLLNSLVFTDDDISAGVGAIAASLVTDSIQKSSGVSQDRPARLLDRTRWEDDPYYKHDSADVANPPVIGDVLIQRRVAFDSLGDDPLSAVGEIVRLALNGEMPISDDIINSIRAKLDAKRDKGRRGRRMTDEALIRECEGAELGEILQSAYVETAITRSIEVHSDFFESFNIASQRREANENDQGIDVSMVRETGQSSLDKISQRNIMRDFKKVVDVLGWTEKDYEIIGEGIGVGYMKAPMIKPEGYEDAIDKIKKLAGENIASIGSNSFMAIVDANEAEGSEHEGAFLMLVERPAIPVHSVRYKKQQIDLNGKLINDTSDGAVDEPESADIKWKVRTWHITNKAYAQMLKRLNTLREDGDTVFVPFVNPRDSIEEIFPYIEALFAARSAQAMRIDSGKNRIVEALNKTIEAATNGENLNLVDEKGMPLTVEAYVINVMSQIGQLPDEATTEAVGKEVQKLTDSVRKNLGSQLPPPLPSSTPVAAELPPA